MQEKQQASAPDGAEAVSQENVQYVQRLLLGRAEAQEHLNKLLNIKKIPKSLLWESI